MSLNGFRSLLVGAGIALLVACGQSTDQDRAGRPPAEVSVLTAQAQDAPLTRELVGRLASTRVAEVRARVAGIVLKRVYTEGTDVTAGQTLFLIDPAPLQAALHAEQAALAKARADAANAAATAKRYRELSAKKLASSQDLDTALANERTTRAAVKEAEAKMEKAELDLGYATVSAPIAGRAGRALVTEGALVGQGETTKMTAIEQVDPLYVNFSQSVAELQELRNAPPGSAKVEVLLPNGKPYSQEGTLDFSDLAVNPGTGTVSLRAVLSNPEHRLLPGMFVKLLLTVDIVKDAFLLPQATLARDAKGAYVLVVDDSGKVQQRRVEVHGMTSSNWILTGELTEGEQVILEGQQKVRPGAAAKAVPAASKDKK